MTFEKQTRLGSLLGEHRSKVIELYNAGYTHAHISQVPPKHHVHHVDCNPYNNSPDNLQCMTHSDHIKLHNRLRMTTNVSTNDLPNRITDDSDTDLFSHDDYKHMHTDTTTSGDDRTSKDTTKDTATQAK